jgi:uncharacterized repeat protein (TIGR02543 family)
VTIPGKWQGGNIKYLKSIDFDAGIGSVSAKTRWVTDGSKVDSLPEPTCQGHVFNGWYTTKSGGTKITSETTVSQNTIFYAQWTANKHEIRFDANGGDGGGVVTLDYGSEIGAFPEVSKVGYSFNGWYLINSDPEDSDGYWGDTDIGNPTIPILPMSEVYSTAPLAASDGPTKYKGSITLPAYPAGASWTVEAQWEEEAPSPSWSGVSIYHPTRGWENYDVYIYDPRANSGLGDWVKYDVYIYNGRWQKMGS